MLSESLWTNVACTGRNGVSFQKGEYSMSTGCGRDLLAGSFPCGGAGGAGQGRWPRGSGLAAVRTPPSDNPRLGAFRGYIGCCWLLLLCAWSSGGYAGGSGAVTEGGWQALLLRLCGLLFWQLSAVSASTLVASGACACRNRATTPARSR